MERAESQVREAQARESALRQTQERMDEFVAVASHDLRSPLTAAIGYNDIAALRYGRLTAAMLDARPELGEKVEVVRADLGETRRSLERMTRLVNLLFDAAQMRADKLELHCLPCDLTALVRDLVVALRVANPRRTVELEMPSDGPVVVMTDADRLGQVVTNYVTNALKYSPEDMPVSVRVARDKEWARVSVRGPRAGLAASEQERIWGRYYQAAGVHAQREFGAGLGLGLHISKAIIEKQGGKVGWKARLARVRHSGLPCRPPMEASR